MGKLKNKIFQVQDNNKKNFAIGKITKQKFQLQDNKMTIRKTSKMGE